MTQQTNLPKNLVIPTPWLVSFLLGGVLHTGMMYQQFQTLRSESEKNSTLVSLIREKQIGGLADLQNIKSEQHTQNARLDGHDQRIVVIERYIIQKDHKR